MRRLVLSPRGLTLASVFWLLFVLPSAGQDAPGTTLAPPEDEDAPATTPVPAPVSEGPGPPHPPEAEELWDYCTEVPTTNRSATLQRWCPAPILPCGGVSVVNPVAARRRVSLGDNVSSAVSDSMSMLDSQQAWTPSTFRNDTWLQLDLGVLHFVLGVVIQGGGASARDSWVTKFHLHHSRDEKEWSPMAGGPFRGASNADTKAQVVFSDISRVVRARYLRIIPQEWVNRIAMRAAVVSCRYQVDCTFAEEYNPPETQRSYSSRAGNAGSSLLDGSDAWTPMSPKDQWLQFSLDSPQELIGVVVQGSPKSKLLLPDFTFKHSLDGKTWFQSQEPDLPPKQLLGPSERNIHKWGLLPSSVQAKFVRILPPQQPNASKEASTAWPLRAGLLRCPRKTEACTDTEHIPKIDYDYFRLLAAVGIKKTVLKMDLKEVKQISGLALAQPTEEGFWASMGALLGGNLQVKPMKLRVQTSENKKQWLELPEVNVNVSMDSILTVPFTAGVRARYVNVYPSEYSNWLRTHLRVVVCLASSTAKARKRSPKNIDDTTTSNPVDKRVHKLRTAGINWREEHDRVVAAVKTAMRNKTWAATREATKAIGTWNKINNQAASAVVDLIFDHVGRNAKAATKAISDWLATKRAAFKNATRPTAKAATTGVEGAAAVSSAEAASKGPAVAAAAKATSRVSTAVSTAKVAAAAALKNVTRRATSAVMKLAGHASTNAAKLGNTTKALVNAWRSVAAAKFTNATKKTVKALQTAAKVAANTVSRGARVVSSVARTAGRAVATTVKTVVTQAVSATRNATRKATSATKKVNNRNAAAATTFANTTKTRVKALKATVAATVVKVANAGKDATAVAKVANAGKDAATVAKVANVGKDAPTRAGARVSNKEPSDPGASKKVVSTTVTGSSSVSDASSSKARPTGTAAVKSATAAGTRSASAVTAAKDRAVSAPPAARSDVKQASRCQCNPVDLKNLSFAAGGVIKCTNCLDVRKVTDKNSCPPGWKLMSPQSEADWETLIQLKAVPVADPDFIIDVTRAAHGCRGCRAAALHSEEAEAAASGWSAVDGSPWFLRSTPLMESAGEYRAGCYLAITDVSKANDIRFAARGCAAHSKSYLCQPSETNVEEEREDQLEEEEEEA